MKHIWKKFAFAVAATVALCALSGQAFAQEAANKLSEFLPKMAPQNMADEGQVREMEAAQQGWMNYCLQDAAKSKEQRAESIKAMCDALESDAPVVTKQWLLHVMQWVGDDSCIGAVAPLLKSDDPRLVDGAAREGIYTILDLHAAPGSQNGRDHSGETRFAKTFHEEKWLDLSCKLWTAVATHYRDNRWVAAYGLANEPEGQPKGLTTAPNVEKGLDALYRAVRAVDTRHLVMIGACWDPCHLPPPSK